MMVCDLTDETHGNAIGVGLADVITRRLFAKIDYEATYANVITSSFLERGKIPVVADTDRDAFDDGVEELRAFAGGTRAHSCASSTRCTSKRSTYRRPLLEELSNRQGHRGAEHRFRPLHRQR